MSTIPQGGGQAAYQTSLPLEQQVALLQVPGVPTFPNLAAVASYVRALSSAEERCTVVGGMASRVVEASAEVDAVMHWLYEYATNEPEMSCRMALNVEIWDQVKKGSERHQDQRNQKAESMRKVI